MQKVNWLNHRLCHQNFAQIGKADTDAPLGRRRRAHGHNPVWQGLIDTKLSKQLKSTPRVKVAFTRQWHRQWLQGEEATRRNFHDGAQT
jgi:hypothetical protein